MGGAAHARGHRHHPRHATAVHNFRTQAWRDAGEVNPWLLTGFHLFNFAAALTGLGISWTRGFREHWRAAAFSLCAMLIVSSTVMSIAAGGRHEALFLSLLHIMLGSAMLVPWESRWQLGLGTLSVSALLANTMLAHQIDPNLLLSLAGRHHRGVPLPVRDELRRALPRAHSTVQGAARTRPATRRKRRKIPPRVRDQLRRDRHHPHQRRPTLSTSTASSSTAPATAVTEAIGRRPSELDLWDDREQARLLSDAIRATGFVRNVEGHFRMRSGESVTALISSVQGDDQRPGMRDQRRARRDRAAQGPRGTGRGARGCPGGLGSQVAISLLHVARDPHSAQRHPRLGRSAHRHPARPRAAPLRRSRDQQRLQPARAAQQHPRPHPRRKRPAQPRADALQRRRADRARRRHARASARARPRSNWWPASHPICRSRCSAIRCA